MTHSRRPGASRSCRGGPAAAADAAAGRGALLSLEEELFAGDPPWTAEQFQSELAGVPQTRWYVVAEANGELAGYAGLMFSGDTADIQTLAVAPAHQRRGIGTTLLFAVLDEARDTGVPASSCSGSTPTTSRRWLSTRATASSRSPAAAATTRAAAPTVCSVPGRIP